MRFDDVAVGDLTFRVREWGPQDGPVVLMLHGFPEHALMWQETAELLDGLRCVAPDQRGYSPGARPTRVEDYHADRLVEDAVGLLDALGVETAHVVGHDFGAVVGWHLVAAHADRVSAFTAVSVPHPGAFARAMADGDAQRNASAYIGFFRTEPDKAAHVLLRDDAAALRAIFTGSGLSEAEVAVFVEPLREPGALDAALCWYRALSADGALLAPSPVPTTFLWGTEDVAVTAGAAHACGDFVTGPYVFRPLEGVTHWLPETYPNVVAHVVASAVLSNPEGGRSTIDP